MATEIENQNIAGIPVFNGSRPDQGGKAVSLNFNFAIAPSLRFDGLKMQQADKLTFVQSLYIDNSASQTITTIVCDGTQQVIVCPPLSQGYFPCLMSSASFTATNVSGASVNIELINVPMPAAVWSAANAAAGTVVVTDIATEANTGATATATEAVAALIAGGALATSNASEAATIGPAGPSAASVGMQQVGAVFNSAGITLTNGQSAALQSTANGLLRTTDSTIAAAVTNVVSGAPGSVALLAGGIFNSGGITIVTGHGAALQMTAAGLLLVSDPAAEASLASIAANASSSNTALSTIAGTVSAAKMQMLNFIRGSADSIHEQFGAFQASYNSITPIAAGQTSTLFTPPAATGIFIKRVLISGFVQGSVAGGETMTLEDNGAPICSFLMSLGTTPSFLQIAVDLDYLSPNINKAITLLQGAATGLTGGSLDVTLMYATTTTPGP